MTATLSLIDLQAAMKRLGCGRTWLLHHLKRNPYHQGKPTHRMIGGKIKFTEDDYARLLETMSVDAAPECSGPGISTAEREIVGASVEWPFRGAGIYFLIDAGRVVYVGRAASVSARIAKHLATKQFTHWHHIPCLTEEAADLEREWIDRLDPPLNRDPFTLKMRLWRQ